MSIYNRKKSLKALFRISLLAVLLLCLIPLHKASAASGEAAVQAGKPSFTDLASDSPLYPYVRYLTDKGIINGFPDGTFRPAESVTRAQAAKIAVLAKGLHPVKDVSPTYSDVPAGYWAFGEIEAATKEGLLRGYPDGTFNPDGTITRAEAITLLLRLSGGELSGNDIVIGDIGRDHWAYRAVITAVEAGLVELPADKLFKPDLAFRRGDLARGLSALFTLGPSLRQTELTGKLAVKKGEVTLTAENGASREVAGETRVGAGTKIITRHNSQAEIAFDDGSGILIDANTEISIVKATGFAYMRSDGSPGTAVDRLEIELKKGKIFGALASRYEKAETSGENKTSFTGGGKEKYITLASTNFSPGFAGILLAENETPGTESQETAWWQEPYSERERVVVDMPWGVCGIRGTFWMNQVSSTGQSTALITGKAVVTAGGKSVTLTGGQSTTITSSGAYPTPPAALTQADKQSWAAVKGWVEERAREIQNNLPVPPAPAVLPPEVPVEQPTAPVEQQQQETAGLAGKIIETFEQDTTGTATTTGSSGNGGSSGGNSNTQIVTAINILNNVITLTFNKAVSEAHIDDTGAWFPVVTLADGIKYKIWIVDSSNDYSMCLHSVSYTPGKNTVDIITFGAMPGKEYKLTVYKGEQFEETVMNSSFTFPEDNTAPTFAAGYPRTENLTENSVDLLVLTNELGTAYYVVLRAQDANDWAPSSAAGVKQWALNPEDDAYSNVTSWSGDFFLSDIESRATVNYLIGGTEYIVYVVAEDESENITGIETISFATPQDNTAPEFATGYPEVTNITAGSVDLSLKINEFGTAYYVALSVNDAVYAPSTAGEVKQWALNPQNSPPNITSWSGSYDWMEPDEEEIVTIYGLEAGAAYNIYMAIEDMSGNLNETFATIQVMTAGGTVVHFNDANLEAAVRDALGKLDGDITSADMAGLTYLSAADRGIADLTGLEYAVNLQELDIWSNQITGISPLAGLTTLQKLELSGNQISDISPLSNLSNLLFLNLGSNQISAISALAGLTGLQDLRLNENQISNIAALADLKNLQYLDLQKNQVSDLAPLVANSGLGEGDIVDLTGNPLDTTPGSQNMLDIQALQARGVNVAY
ncbi:hypothetical membrane protein [Pelotomaculum thermopropionicum SI]|uniref:Hypothetical membrane protein n=1 Tax=Pelotomaculum thermopropionicum (strain DSM 13744 / JCM 10971 / SI) TaxID=370438 RepID=A5CYD5_PELTS|nr:hypothetical membrane protein [Pelotomaculum thermopropionicum SI]